MKPAEDKTPKKQTSSGTGAKIIVDLPADAKLFIDDRPVKSTSQHPIFATPQLEEGKTYYYEMRVELVRNGQVATNTKRVLCLVCCPGCHHPRNDTLRKAGASDPVSSKDERPAIQ